MTATLAASASRRADYYEQIKDDLGYLKLHRSAEVFPGLLDRARTERLTHAVPGRARRRGSHRHPQPRLNARLRFAHFPTRRTIEEFDFDFQPSIDRKLIDDLAGLGSSAGTPILFLGKPGCGKTHLAIALGIRAVEAGYRGYFTTATDMVAAMTTAYADGTFATKIRTYTGPTVLVIDDVGITPFDRAAANAFFQVVNRRYENRSATIVTTNRGLPAWAELFGDAVVAAAILDRLLDRAVVINIKGPSWRLREHQALVDRIREGVGARI